MKASNIFDLIGNTPHLRINNLYKSTHEVWIKIEKNNPGGSIKDRIALGMVEDAEKKGILKKGSVIVEPTSGNTGIGLAMVAALKKYSIILVMPESMSIERRKIMSAYGANFELTPKEKGMLGAIERANEIVALNRNAWMPQQFDNQANIDIHFNQTAKEILEDFPGGIDYLVTGVGTGGHITGCAKALKKIKPDVKIYAVEPDTSPVLSGGKSGSHSIQGIGAGFLPENYDKNYIDGVIKVSKSEAYLYCNRAAREEGLFAGISTGASLAAIGKKYKEFEPGSTILTFNYDSGDRYVSVEGLYD